MIIFLYGRDGYRLKQNQDKIVEEYNKKYSGLSYFALDIGEHGQVKVLEDIIKTISFFDEKKLIVISDAFLEADKIVELIKTWDLISDKQIILIFKENADRTELAKKNKKFFAVLSAKPNLVKFFEPLTGTKLESWLVKEVRIAGYEIEKTALVKLTDALIDKNSKEADPSACWRARQELDKLLNYKLAVSSRLIVEKDIDLLVVPRTGLNVFNIIDAFAFKNKAKAIVLLHNYLENGDDPYNVFSMIVYQTRNLLRVKSLVKDAVPYADIVKKTNLHPFVVKKTYEQCQKYDLEELRGLFARLVQTEIGVKTGELDMDEGLFRFLFAL